MKCFTQDHQSKASFPPPALIHIVSLFCSAYCFSPSLTCREGEPLPLVSLYATTSPALLFSLHLAIIRALPIILCLRRKSLHYTVSFPPDICEWSYPAWPADLPLDLDQSVCSGLSHLRALAPNRCSGSIRETLVWSGATDKPRTRQTGSLVSNSGVLAYLQVQLKTCESPDTRIKLNWHGVESNSISSPGADRPLVAASLQHTNHRRKPVLRQHWLASSHLRESFAAAILRVFQLEQSVSFSRSPFFFLAYFIIYFASASRRSSSSSCSSWTGKRDNWWTCQDNIRRVFSANVL